MPDRLLITDFGGDGRPEVTAIKAGKPLIWVRFPFDKPPRLRFKNCQAVWMGYRRSILEALPVLTADNRLPIDWGTFCLFDLDEDG